MGYDGRPIGPDLTIVTVVLQYGVFPTLPSITGGRMQNLLARQYRNLYSFDNTGILLGEYFQPLLDEVKS